MKLWKRTVLSIGWFVDKILLNILFLLFFIPINIVVLPIGVFNPVKRKLIRWAEPICEESEDALFGICVVWCFILFAFTWLFIVAPLYTFAFIGISLLIIIFVFCYCAYKCEGDK